MKKFVILLLAGSTLLLIAALSDLLFPLAHWQRSLCFGVGMACIGLWTVLKVRSAF